MGAIEDLAEGIIADNGAWASAGIVDRIGQGDSPVVYEALRKIVLNEQNEEEVREKALNYLMVIVSRAIGARRAPGGMSEEAMRWAGDLGADDAVKRANAAINIMIYGGVETLGPLMEAMRVERNEEARTAMLEAGRALLMRCEGELGLSAAVRARKAIDAVEAFQRRAMEICLPGERMAGPTDDVSGNITVEVRKAKK